MAQEHNSSIVSNQPDLTKKDKQIIANENVQPVEQSVNIPNRCAECIRGVYDLFCCNIGCYRKDSPDMRCCGLSAGSQDMGCFPTLSEFFKSPLCITYDWLANLERDDDCCCALLCSIKLIFTTPCLVGTMVNSIINYIRGTHGNYLC
jgi:hypothetical protein